MTQELLKRYQPNYLGVMILVLSLDGFQKILPHIFLKLDDPKAFQRACFAATKEVPEAYYDENAVGWHQWHEKIGANFSKRAVYDIAQPDRNRVLHWLENGNPCQFHGFAHRHFWAGACTWAHKSDAVAEHFNGPDLMVIKNFAEGVFTEKNDPAYSEIKEDIASTPETFFDTWQKTKFHIYIIPGAMISAPFIGLNWMRTSHIVKKHTDSYLLKGGDPALLERMVILYSELKESETKWSQPYIDDKEAFKIENLWSNKFRESEFS